MCRYPLDAKLAPSVDLPLPWRPIKHSSGIVLLALQALGHAGDVAAHFAERFDGLR